MRRGEGGGGVAPRPSAHRDEKSGRASRIIMASFSSSASGVKRRSTLRPGSFVDDSFKSTIADRGIGAGLTVIVNRSDEDPWMTLPDGQKEKCAYCGPDASTAIGYVNLRFKRRLPLFVSAGGVIFKCDKCSTDCFARITEIIVKPPCVLRFTHTPLEGEALDDDYEVVESDDYDFMYIPKDDFFEVAESWRGDLEGLKCVTVMAIKLTEEQAKPEDERIAQAMKENEEIEAALEAKLSSIELVDTAIAKGVDEKLVRQTEAVQEKLVQQTEAVQNDVKEQTLAVDKVDDMIDGVETAEDLQEAAKAVAEVKRETSVMRTEKLSVLDNLQQQNSEQEAKVAAEKAKAERALERMAEKRKVFADFKGQFLSTLDNFKTMFLRKIGGIGHGSALLAQLKERMKLKSSGDEHVSPPLRKKVKNSLDKLEKDLAELDLEEKSLTTLTDSIQQMINKMRETETKINEQIQLISDLEKVCEDLDQRMAKAAEQLAG